MLIPAIVHSDPEMAQITYDLTLVLCMLGCLFFLPFLMVLVYI